MYRKLVIAVDAKTCTRYKKGWFVSLFQRFTTVSETISISMDNKSYRCFVELKYHKDNKFKNVDIKLSIGFVNVFL